MHPAEIGFTAGNLAWGQQTIFDLVGRDRQGNQQYLETRHSSALLNVPALTNPHPARAFGSKILINISALHG
jgi:hypothetical protein